MWTQQEHTDAQEKGNGTCLHATLPAEGQRLPAGPASPLCASPAQAESAGFCCVCAPGLGRSKALPTPGSAGKVWVNRSKNGPSRDRTGPQFRPSLTTKDRLPESSCLLLPGVEGSASSSSRYPLLSRTGTARPRPGPWDAARAQPPGPLSISPTPSSRPQWRGLLKLTFPSLQLRCTMTSAREASLKTGV